MSNTLIESAQQFLNITLTPEQAEAMEQLIVELQDWNTRMNLTTITDTDEARVRHVLDSLSVGMNFTFNEGDKLIDVGTGAGFPGLPLAMLYPQLQVTLLDSTRKKLRFSEHIIKLFHLRNARILHMRAEDAGQNVRHRAIYDVVVARAVALLPTLAEYLLPLTKTGGYCIAMKGSSAEREADEAKQALKLLGGQVVDITRVQFPGVEHAHHLIIIEKVRKTPGRYPRQSGTPKKTPLGMPED